MDGTGRLLVLVLLSISGRHWSEGKPLNPFPLGTIGCLVSDVCDTGEICTNDLLFGSCQSKFSRILNGENKFELSTDQIEDLEKEIRSLIKSGFTWKDAYAQCALQNTLVEFQYGRRFDRYLCEDALGVASPDWSADAKDEIADVLLQLLNSGAVEFDEDDLPESVRPQETGLDILNSNKRDEIVKVHKYFDKSKGLLKRDPLFMGSGSDGSSYGMLYPGGEKINPGPLYYPMAESESYQDEQELPREDDQLAFVEDEEAPRSQDSLMERYLQDMLAGRQGGVGLESYMGDEQEPQDEPSQDDDLPSVQSMIDQLALSEEDEAALAGLGKGTLFVEDLEPAQLARLKVFIETLIKLLEAEAQEEGYTESGEFDSSGPATDPMIPEEIAVQDYPEQVPDMLGEDSEDVLSETDPRQLRAPDGDGEKELLEEVLETGELPMDKKMSDEEEEEGNDGPVVDEPFDLNTMFLELSKGVTKDEAKLFVNNITEILGLPKGMLEFTRRLSAHMIVLKVEDDPSGQWNAINIGEAARARNADLENRTHVTILKAGEGEGSYAQYQGPPSPQEAKQNNRYVVLTFILVGTIAGVVLAVVTIYLIKRHHRSRQKLANLAANSDGNEASKDYQDLCRQRMQGKSNEKPEPLHAASRIGSVSESQVRSPSSRSSTSSWSEEPAATNMDISTGHIVLSYMEDHLRNQDRLDREWEAVSGYVADPASTKVASDPCNTRKNRFTDILPYDHSRVILSSGANVANSDFINASFITDHDPRNPAYITTQGPLPHTVADFWQMIWEQGSVVIVMLTKLTENGTSLCHRYWPEEGSDLYHIYEVHLVSEHIWCDDYLVRSFYLKNLQTNETRTVTQFHFLTWPQLSVPASIKALLDFRRKVNKSFRGRSCPIVVHCSDGCGRSGTYCLIDMVLNKMAKGAKEIDMAATLEHIRDQRMNMVTTKEQFQFSLAAVAEEVHAILKALPQ